MTAPTPSPVAAFQFSAQAIEAALTAWHRHEGPTNQKQHSAMRAALEAALDGMVVVPLPDYQRLLLAAEADDMIVTCETCGAWLDRDDPTTACIDDYTGCWKVAAGEDSERCKSYRAAATPPAASEGEERK